MGFPWRFEPLLQPSVEYRFAHCLCRRSNRPDLAHRPDQRGYREFRREEHNLLPYPGLSCAITDVIHDAAKARIEALDGDNVVIRNDPRPIFHFARNMVS